MSPPRRVPTEEGYLVVPVELGMQVYIPVGSRSWRLSMGGGIGGYYSERIFSIAGARAVPVGSRMGFGIHVAINTEYRFTPGIAVTASMKFRDPEIDVNNRFTSSSVIYNNVPLPLPQNDIHSRVNIDGLTLGLGVLVEIF